MENFKSGFLALVGKPNAGKSTLLNSLIRQKVSIVSPKPQTTRNKVLGIWTQDDCQMVFVDMPGIIKPKNTLGQYMEKSIDSGVRDVDCVVYVTDGHKGVSDDDLALMQKYGAKNSPMVAVVKDGYLSAGKTYGRVEQTKQFAVCQRNLLRIRKAQQKYRRA